MGYSFPDQVPTNVLTINAIGPLCPERLS
jgi:hypothetical protein